MDNPKLFSFCDGRYATGATGPHHYSTDITLRDLFAAACIAGVSSGEEVHVDLDSDDAKRWNAHAAKAAYMQADAMLKARQKGES